MQTTGSSKKLKADPNEESASVVTRLTRSRSHKPQPDSSMAPKTSRALRTRMQPDQAQAQPKASSSMIHSDLRASRSKASKTITHPTPQLDDKESSTFMATIMGDGRAPGPQATETRPTEGPSFCYSFSISVSIRSSLNQGQRQRLKQFYSKFNLYSCCL